MNRFVFLCAGAALLWCGCSTIPVPSRAYEANLFAVAPVIVQRGANYYLRYRMAGVGSPPRMIVHVHAEQTKAVAYFTAPVSWPEWGATIELPLAAYRATEFARDGRLVWRNPDGTELPIRQVTEE